MTTLSVKDSRETVAEHLSTLRGYAQRVLAKGESLTESEEADKAHRMREMLSIGTSFKLTENEMVGLVLKEMHTRKPRCGCPICRGARRPQRIAARAGPQRSAIQRIVPLCWQACKTAGPPVRQPAEVGQPTGALSAR